MADSDDGIAVASDPSDACSDGVVVVSLPDRRKRRKKAPIFTGLFLLLLAGHVLNDDCQVCNSITGVDALRDLPPLARQNRFGVIVAEWTVHSARKELDGISNAVHKAILRRIRRQVFAFLDYTVVHAFEADSLPSELANYIGLEDADVLLNAAAGITFDHGKTLEAIMNEFSLSRPTYCVVVSSLLGAMVFGKQIKLFRSIALSLRNDWDLVIPNMPRLRLLKKLLGILRDDGVSRPDPVSAPGAEDEMTDVHQSRFEHANSIIQSHVPPLSLLRFLAFGNMLRNLANASEALLRVLHCALPADRSSEIHACVCGPHFSNQNYRAKMFCELMTSKFAFSTSTCMLTLSGTIHELSRYGFRLEFY